MVYSITLIPGDGTGPELTEATRRVLDATGVEFNWEIEEGEDLLRTVGAPLSSRALESIRKNKIALKGPISTPTGTSCRSVNAALCQELDLYAGLRPCKSYQGVRRSSDHLDLVIIFETFDDLYAGSELHENAPSSTRPSGLTELSRSQTFHSDYAAGIASDSEARTRQTVNFAFEYATENRLRKVTAVTKVDVMKLADEAFLEVARTVAQQYPAIGYEELLVNDVSIRLLEKPQLCDVLVMPNYCSDTCFDRCKSVIGGPGVVPGAFIGEGTALFEPAHGSAPKYAGMNKVNPLATIFSGLLMLRYLKEIAAAKRLELAMSEVIAEGKCVTYDLKPDRHDPTAVGTSQVADAIIAKLKAA